MKTFKQFLMHEDVSYSPGGASALRDFLKKHSPDALAAAIQTDSVLVRGQSGGTGDVVFRASTDDYIFTVYEMTTRKRRKPIDTPETISKYIDDWFAANGFGRPRSEGVFTTSGDDAEHVVSAYGNGVAYAIFPLGSAEYVWSPDVYDLYETLSNFAVTKDLISIDTLTQDQVNEMMGQLNWQKSNSPEQAIIDASESGSAIEIIAMCDQFLALEINDRTSAVIGRIMNPATIARILQGE